MAKPQKEQAVWRPVARVEDKPIFEEGDIYAPLRRLVERYQQRAEKLMEKAHDCHVNDPDSKRNLGILKGASAYLEQARRVLMLIPDDEPVPLYAEPLTPEDVNALGLGFDVPADATITGIEVSAQ